MMPLVSGLAAHAAVPLTALWAAVPPGDADPASGKGPEWGKAAPVGLLIWLLLGLALFLLIKSMNRNLRKVPKSFDPADEPGGADVDDAGANRGDVALDEERGGDGASGADRSGGGDPGSGPPDDGTAGDERPGAVPGGDERSGAGHSR